MCFKIIGIVCGVIMSISIHGQNTATINDNPKSAIMSVSMWMAQMSTMNRPYSQRFNPHPIPDRSAEASGNITCPNTEPMYRTADGSCNNIINPNLGQSFTPFKRLIPAHYSDRFCLPRNRGRCKIAAYKKKCYVPYLPSARSISTTVHTEQSIVSDHSLLFLFWGQFVYNDISAIGIEQTATPNPCCENSQAKKGYMHPDTYKRCSGKCFPISIKQDPVDRFFNEKCMEFVRSKPVDFNISIKTPREQQNLVTGFLDASTVYGSDQETQNKVRGFEGSLKLSPEELLPVGREEDCIFKKSTHCFTAGDERVNVSPGLSLLHTVMVYFHNHIAEELFEILVNEEQAFQETRKFISALIQKITYLEYLPEVLNKETLERYNLTAGSYTYDSDTDPTVANVFATSAFQFMDSLTPSLFQYAGEEIPTRDVFNNPYLMFRGEPDVLGKSILSTAAEVRDRFFSREITDHYFQVGNKSFDLVAQIIKRGRDHGLPAYRWFRNYCELDRVIDFTSKALGTSATVLQKAYDHVDDIDIFTGGMAEPSLPGSILGPTFSCLIGKQFRDLKFGDSFWYETDDLKKGFTSDQLKVINGISMVNVLCEALDLELIQENPFRMKSPSNPWIDCDNLPEINFDPWLSVK